MAHRAKAADPTRRPAAREHGSNAALAIRSLPPNSGALRFRRSSCRKERLQRRRPRPRGIPGGGRGQFLQPDQHACNWPPDPKRREADPQVDGLARAKAEVRARPFQARQKVRRPASKHFRRLGLAPGGELRPPSATRPRAFPSKLSQETTAAPRLCRRGALPATAADRAAAKASSARTRPAAITARSAGSSARRLPHSIRRAGARCAEGPSSIPDVRRSPAE